jgi:hypothetical protein
MNRNAVRNVKSAGQGQTAFSYTNESHNLDLRGLVLEMQMPKVTHISFTKFPRHFAEHHKEASGCVPVLRRLKRQVYNESCLGIFGSVIGS